jgi:hypothetical protein
VLTIDARRSPALRRVSDPRRGKAQRPFTVIRDQADHDAGG